MEPNSEYKIAIIGMGCLLPKAHNPEEFWQNLIEEKDSTSLATEKEMGVDPDLYFDPHKGTIDKYYWMRGGFVRDFSFDPTGYRLPPERLAGLDNIFKWSLYVSRQALEDGGYLSDEQALADCGLILGNLSFPTRSSDRLVIPIYQHALEKNIGELLEQPEFHLERLPKLDQAEVSADNIDNIDNMLISGYPAGIVAQALALQGGHFGMDAACATSLYAVKLACHYLIAGKAEMMLAGAVSAADPFNLHMGFSIFHAYPSEGADSRPLDRSSRGLRSAEGAGMLLLKRYEDALRDGDQIYAVIRGAGLSNDGRGKHTLTPNPKGQRLAFERAYADAGVSPHSVDYVECHATGTPLGDVTELNSMETFWKSTQEASKPSDGSHLPLVGSVKSNFGHLLTAAGMAGIIKSVLGMKRGVIPATINVQEPLSSQEKMITGTQIVRTATPWPTRNDPDGQNLPLAGVTAFGFGGTNAHLILEAAPNEELRIVFAVAPNCELRNGNPKSEIRNPKSEIPAPPPPAPPPILGEGSQATGEGSLGEESQPPISSFVGARRADQGLARSGAYYRPPRPEGGRSERPEVPLAIVGMNAFFGPCEGLEAFHRTLYEGQQHFIPLPATRWKGIDAHSDLLKEYGFEDGVPPKGAYIEGFEMDFLYFKNPPSPADQPIPQHLLMLKVADNAVQDAGLKEGANVAVVIAMGTELAQHQYRGRVDLTWQLKGALAEAGITLSPEEEADLEKMAKDILHRPAKVNQYTSFIGNIIATRISALWDFVGPSFTVSVEENSVWGALEVAQVLLATDEVEAVVVGAVDLSGGVENVLLRNRMIQINNRVPTLSYDRDANGWMVGEGAGAVVLKRHDQARANGEHIYAVIQALATASAPTPSPSQFLHVVQDDNNRGGEKEAPTSSPSQDDNNRGGELAGETIARASRDALARANISPDDVAYLEVCGSGIAHEDDAEIQGLLAAYAGATADGAIALGSVKANIGHTYCASGMASLIKTALCLHHRFIPATPGWSAPKNPAMWENSHFYVPTESRPWFSPALEPVLDSSVDAQEREISKRVAAISGFGLDGMAAHLILTEDSPQRESGTGLSDRATARDCPYLFPLAGDDRAELLAQLDELEQLIESESALPAVASQAYAKFASRPQAVYALSICGAPDQLLQEIGRARKGVARAFDKGKEWQTPRGSCFSATPLGSEGGQKQVAFVYPGAFNSYVGLGQDLFDLFPALYERLGEVSSNLGRAAGDKLIYPRSMSRLSRDEITALEKELVEDAITMLESGLTFATSSTTILRDEFGVKPAAAFGYSLGEASMMWALGLWTAGDEASEGLRHSELFTTRLAGPKNAIRESWKSASQREDEGNPDEGSPDEGNPDEGNHDEGNPDEGNREGLPLQEGNREGLPLPWQTYVLMSPAEKVEPHVKEEPHVYLTIINSPKEVVIAGDPEGCQRVIEKVGGHSLRAPFDHALHCEPMSSEYDEFVRLHRYPVSDALLSGQKELPTLYSASEYGPIALSSEGLGHHVAAVSCKELDFPRLVRQVYDNGARIFIELGASRTCSRWISAILKGQPHVAIPIDKKGVDNYTSIVRVLAKLVTHRVPVDLSPLYRPDTTSQSDSDAPRTLIRRVITGGARIGDELLAEENKQKFAAALAAPAPLVVEAGSPSPLVVGASSPSDSLVVGADSLVVGTDSLVVGASSPSDSLVVGASSPSEAPVAPASLVVGASSPSEAPVAPLPLVVGASSPSEAPVAPTSTSDTDLEMIPQGLASQSQPEVMENDAPVVRSTMTELYLPEKAPMIQAELGAMGNSAIANSGIANSAIAFTEWQQLHLQMLAALESSSRASQGHRAFLEARQDASQQLSTLIELQMALLEQTALPAQSEEAQSDTQSDIASQAPVAFAQMPAEKGFAANEDDGRLTGQTLDYEPLTASETGSQTGSESNVSPPSEADLAALGAARAELAPSLASPPPVPRQARQPSVALVPELVEGQEPAQAGFNPLKALVLPPQAGVLGGSKPAQARFDPIVPSVTPARPAGAPFGTPIEPLARQGGTKIARQADKTVTPSLAHPPTPGSTSAKSEAPQTQEIVWDEADLLEFAQGKIANVFGPEYGIIDSYSRRVRLPTPPYLLVSRVTKLSATRGRFEPCSLTTEYDIPHDAWYLVDGQTPWAVAVESGQCDLLLISYLGIDFECKGERVYRLLDATLTFLDEIPMGGDTLRYDISINSYARSGPSLLFFFSYNCYIGEKLVLTMRNGCAGFFTDQELAEGQGVIFSDSELEAFGNVQPQRFEPLLKSSKSSFTYADLLLGSEGKMAECFGPDYDQAGLNPSLRLPPPMMLMADRILSIDPHGGRWGLGLVMAEKDLLPEDWYFPCHFMDDQVLAGSLMSDGCVQLMQFYMLYLGFQTETKDARFHPLNDLPQSVRCRGQVTPINRKMTYKLEITEIGLTPEPYAKANVSIMVDGKFAVYFEDLGLRLVEKDASDPFKIDPFDKLRDRAGSSSGSGGSSSTTPPKEVGRKKALFDEADIEAFATGSIVDCFGEEYAIYTDRRASRTPNGPLKLVSRIVEINAQRHDIKPLSSLVSEYDVPADAWFYQENNAPTMPYSILLEIALQPCGFLSAYLGSTLPYPEIDFYFRNLDGQATLSKVIDLRGKTITNRVRLLSSTAIQGIVIQKFDYELLADGELFYKGDAVFGYFTKEALSDQVGLDSGKFVPPWCQAPEANIEGAIKIDLRSAALVPELVEGRQAQEPGLYRAPSGKPHYRLAQQRLNLLDDVLIVPNGGRHQEGYIYGAKAVDPNDWFFTAHFYQDPVMPGSLGIEAILQAMQTYALQAGLGAEFDSPYFELLADHHMIWKYRGQIPHIKIQMQVDVHLTRIEKSAQQITLYGDASLWRDKLRVYEIKNIALNILESPK